MKKSFIFVVALFFLQVSLFTLFLPGMVRAAGTTGSRGDSKGLMQLPETARGYIGEALGRDNPVYHFQPISGSWQGQHPNQGFTSFLTSEGLQVRAPELDLHLRLAAYGYEGHLCPARQPAPLVNTNRIEYQHGPITEWYVNGPLGLEQGFTVHHPFSNSDSPNDRVTLSVSFETGLLARLDEGGRGVTFCGKNGRAEIHYNGLTAFDAAGKELRAWLEVDKKEGNLFYIKVDDSGARYPLTIDPWIQSAKLTASDGAGFDNLGHSVAISGNTVVLGAPYAKIGGNTDQGAAYIFKKPQTGWTNLTQTAKLTASDGGAYDNFGISVAIEGETVVVGAMGKNTNQGTAYVFIKPGGGWVDMKENARLTASDGASGAFLGSSVSISGNTALVGAMGKNTSQGAAYVYEKPGTGWTDMTQNAKLTASDGAAGDSLGNSVSISEDNALVGSPGNNSGQGAAYVFKKPGTGWNDMTQNAKLTASDGAVGDRFGESVSISGQKAVSGADYAAVDGKSRQGKVYVFLKPTAGWKNMTQTNQLTSLDGAAFDYFGKSVAVDVYSVAVGAYFATVEAHPYQGAGYLFQLLYTLSISKSGTGTGTVTGPGISCGTDCSEPFNAGTQVSLTAAADADSVFTGWSGACNGATNPCTVTMDANKAVTPSFDITYHLYLPLVQKN